MKAQKVQGFLVFCCILLLLANTSWAQDTGNPFDFLSSEPAPTTFPTTSDNPFDLVAAAPQPATPKMLPQNQKEIEEMLRFKDKTTLDISETELYRFKVIISLLLTGLLSILLTTSRRTLQHLFEAFLNQNMLVLLLREQTKGIQRGYWLFYLLFFFAAGFALYLISQRMGLYLPLPPLAQWLLYSIAVFGVFSIKHLLLSIVGLVFPLSKPLIAYSFTIMVFSCILGLYLVPIDILLALGSKHVQQMAFVGLITGVGLLYAYRILRSFFIALPYAMNYPMHFLLYLCAVEIAPLLILWRFVTTWQK